MICNKGTPQDFDTTQNLTYFYDDTAIDDETECDANQCRDLSEYGLEYLNKAIRYQYN